MQRWPWNSTRFLLPCVAVRGFVGGPGRLVVAFWVWRWHFEFCPMKRCLFKFIYRVSDFFRRLCWRISRQFVAAGEWIDNHVTMPAYHRSNGYGNDFE